MKNYDPPEVTEYGTVTDITELDKVGDEEDEASEIIEGLTGSIGYPRA